MSVIVEGIDYDEDRGKKILLTKGADNIIL